MPSTQIISTHTVAHHFHPATVWSWSIHQRRLLWPSSADTPWILLHTSVYRPLQSPHRYDVCGHRRRLYGRRHRQHPRQQIHAVVGMPFAHLVIYIMDGSLLRNWPWQSSLYSKFDASQPPPITEAETVVSKEPATRWHKCCRWWSMSDKTTGIYTCHIHVEFAYNNVVSAATGLAPNQVHMGRLPSLLLTVFDNVYAREHQNLSYFNGIHHHMRCTSRP